VRSQRPERMLRHIQSTRRNWSSETGVEQSPPKTKESLRRTSLNEHHPNILRPPCWAFAVLPYKTMIMDNRCPGTPTNAHPQVAPWAGGRAGIKVGDTENLEP